jgi:hypothetical protein
MIPGGEGAPVAYRNFYASLARPILERSGTNEVEEGGLLVSFAQSAATPDAEILPLSYISALADKKALSAWSQ